MKNFCLILFLIWLLASCSPQKRLNRLIANHPELAKTDTIYSTKTFTVPGYKIDTTFKASTNTNGIDDILINYKDYLDSIRAKQLSNQIKTYVVNRSCLDDTFKIQLRDGGFCKLWQTKGFFYYQVNQPNKKYQFSVPMVSNKFDVQTKYNWIMFWIGFSVIPFLITVFFIIKKIYSPI